MLPQFIHLHANGVIFVFLLPIYIEGIYKRPKYERKIPMNDQSNTKKASALSDEEIISLFWKREEQAIEATDVKYGRYLYTIALNILNDNLDSEECLNDTYLGTWNAIPPAKPKLFMAFLSKIMRNTALARLRRASAAKRIPSNMSISLEELDECVQWEPGEDEKYFVTRLSECFNAYLDTLTDRQLFIFVCRYYYSDSVVRIADMLKLSKNTVFRDLVAIRQGLREHLEKEGFSV